MSGSCAAASTSSVLSIVPAPCSRPAGGTGRDRLSRLSAQCGRRVRAGRAGTAHALMAVIWRPLVPVMGSSPADGELLRPRHTARSRREAGMWERLYTVGAGWVARGRTLAAGPGGLCWLRYISWRGGHADWRGARWAWRGAMRNRGKSLGLSLVRTEHRRHRELGKSTLLAW